MNIHDALYAEAALAVRWFRHRTVIVGATYELDLTPARARLSMTVPSPYLLSVGTTWDRVCAAGFDLTRILTQTDDVLRATLDAALSWQFRVIATETQGVVTAHARLNLEQLTLDQLTAIRATLPRDACTRTWLRYERHPQRYLSVADRVNEERPGVKEREDRESLR